MSCGDTGRFPVLSGRICQVLEVQNRLLHWQAGNPPPWDPFSYALEEVRQEIILECLLNWAGGVPDVRGDLFQEFPLLLELLMQTSVICLWVLASHL